MIATEVNRFQVSRFARKLTSIVRLFEVLCSLLLSAFVLQVFARDVMIVQPRPTSPLRAWHYFLLHDEADVWPERGFEVCSSCFPL